VVDTGTSREAIVSPALMRELQLPLVGRTWLLDLTGNSRQAVDEVLLQTVELPGHSFRSVTAMVHEPVAALAPYDGVLGFSLFREIVLTLDFPARCMRLTQDGLTERGDPNVLAFSMPRNVPVVRLTIGEQNVPAQIDSAGGGMNLPRSAAPAVEFARDTEVLVRAESQVSTFLLHGGVLNGEVGLGGHVFRRPFVELGEQIPVGNLGAVSLQDFALTFDQANRLVRFQARNRVHRLERTHLGPAVPARARRDAMPPIFSGGS
jgi:hypothetical protein